MNKHETPHAANDGNNHLPALEALHEEGEQEHAEERACKESGKEERILEEAPLLRRGKQSEKHAEHAPHDRPDFSTFESAHSGRFVPAEKIPFGCIAERIDGTGKAAHGGGTDGGDNQAGHAYRKSVYDKIREYIVLADALGKGGNMRNLVIHIECSTYPVEKNRDEAT